MQAPSGRSNSGSAGNFVGYHKISDRTSNWLLPRGGAKLGKVWVATEKVHGANFCFIMRRLRHDGEDSVQVRCGKRREVLGENEDFFGHVVLLERVRPKAINLFCAIEGQRNAVLANHVGGLQSCSKKGVPGKEFGEVEVEEVLLFGELCGGRYPHPEVQPDTRVEAVQTGVYYSPTIEFYAFDIALVLAGRVNQATQEPLFFLDYDKALEIFRSIGMLCAEPLATGTYEDMLAYPVEFESTISARLGLPPLSNPNRAEGIVLKPMKTLYVQTSKGTSVRAIVKKKTKAFSEENQYRQAEKWQTKATTYGASEMLDFEMYALVTRNRLNNVISKMGRVEATDRDKVMEMLRNLMDDILEQLQEDNAEDMKSLSAVALADLKRKLRAECKQVILQYFKERASKPKD